MAADGSMEDRSSRRRSSEFGFSWVSSSPTPAEVASLEVRFPEVVKIPESDLEEETATWLNFAVLARSFVRWVPIEAYIREFRRAGISGAIIPVSLAYRCCIFRFEDPAACELVLNRPWVINGQIIATEAWHPEFFPAKNSISSAMVWMRLPNLPMEFWKKESLRSISELAGLFLCADAATLAKNRGGYARVAVRVDLRWPLRPGSRVQGLRDPFWQPFVYEALEGFCPSCGSLHLDGSCSEAVMAEKGDAAACSVFGPWLAAVRQRRPATVKPTSSFGKTASGPSSSVGLDSSAPSSFPPPVSSDVSQVEGWKVPTRTSRRRTPGLVKSSLQGLGGVKVGPEPLVDLPSAGGSKGSVNAKKLLKRVEAPKVFSSIVAVPVFNARAGFKEVKENIQTEAIKSHSLASVNPFASLDLISDDAGHDKVGVKVSGPLKRARPAECLPPRAIPNLDKRKGKGKSKMVNCRVDFISSSHIPPLPFCGQTSDREEVEVISVCPADRMSVPPSVVALDQGSLNTAADPVVMQEYSTQNDVEGSGSAGHHPDSLMIEDQVVVQAISN